MIRHIVMWKFKDGEIENAKAFLSKLEALKAVIPEIVNVQTGINMNPKNDFDAVLIADFNTMEDLQSYAGNPLHLEAAAFCKDSRLKREAIDFEF